MALSKENPSSSSQLQSLMDLLMDLQILNSPPEATEESPPSKEDVTSQGEHTTEQAREAVWLKLVGDGEAKRDKEDEGNRGGFFSEPTTYNHSLEEANGLAEIHSLAESPWDSNSPLASPTHEQNNLLSLLESGSFSSFASQLLEDYQNSPTNDLPVLESEPNQLVQPQLDEEQFKETTYQSILAADNLATDDSLCTAEDLPNQLVQSQWQEEQPEESTNQPLQAEENLQQPENLDTSPDDVFNRLINAHWQTAQSEQPTIESIASATDKNIENSIELFERWQRLLLTQEVMDSRKTLANFKEKLEGIEHQIYEPTQLINLLLPLITRILSLKVAESREDIAKAIAPLVDEMIQHRSEQDKEAMSCALAPVLPEAVAKGVSTHPGVLAKALGPEMGTAIKEQIALERDAMVDALYPVIGSTISKYMADAIQSINEKVENAFSLEGISRKIRAKMQGVSEAELILKEAIPFTVQAFFLIHKGSGLVIAEVQPSDSHTLESEMVAGMLTAIRSFVNDVIAQSGNVSEIDQIEYGNSKIILEVAGYCYIAAVTQGEPPKSFMKKMRGTLSSIVQIYGKEIELFDGDPSNVPEQINQLLQELTTLSKKTTDAQKAKPPIALMVVGAAVVSAIVIPVGIYQHLSAIDHRYEEETSLALESDPELAVYRLSVDAHLGTLKLSGKLPNQYLRSRAEQITKKVAPKLKIYNAIIPVEVPPDPVLAQAEVKRVTNLLNQMEGAVIWADYSEGKVTVQGTVLQESDAKKITQAFLQIPGVKSVSSTVQLQPLAIASRVYFDQGASELKSDELSKISPIRQFLKQYPNKRLRVLGHTDPKGTATENEQLALERAKKVRDVLVAQGVDSNRLQVEGTTNFPLGVNAEQVPLLSRCVEFQIISP